MARVHYDEAFELCLRQTGRPFLRIDESRRASFSGTRIKSFDFVLSRPEGGAWLVDLKGRKVNASSGSPSWQNWVTQDDLIGLDRWETAFNRAGEAAFVFAFWHPDPATTAPPREAAPFRWAGSVYRFYVLTLRDYARHARLRSRRWRTLALPTGAFWRLARPLFAETAPNRPEPGGQGFLQTAAVSSSLYREPGPAYNAVNMTAGGEIPRPRRSAEVDPLQGFLKA